MRIAIAAAFFALVAATPHYSGKNLVRLRAALNGNADLNDTILSSTLDQGETVGPLRRYLPSHYPLERRHHREGLVAYDPDDRADEATWTKHLGKGASFLEGMYGDDAKAGCVMGKESAQSPWTGGLTNELKEWGWNYNQPDELQCDFETWKVTDIMAALKISDKAKDNTCYDIVHEDPSKKDKDGRKIPAKLQTYQKGGKTYHASGAYYKFAVNQKDGVIFEQYVESPRWAWEANYGYFPEADKLPELRAFSDAMWGHWYRNNPDIGKIKYFWVQGCANEITQQIINTALKNKKRRLGTWPGVTFDAQSNEGKALLGTPNGGSIGFFLIQRKAELGNKAVTKIQVFIPDVDEDEQEFQDPDILFHIESVPEPKGGGILPPRALGMLNSRIVRGVEHMDRRHVLVAGV